MNMKLGPGEPLAGPWRVTPIRDLVRLVFDTDQARDGRPWILAVDGRSGSGKSTVAALLHRSVPASAIVHTDEPLGVYGAIDCGGYVSNFMLAAQALGLGVIAQAALAHQSGLIRRHFGLGDDRRVVCGISFGYPDRDHRINSYRMKDRVET